MRHEHQSASASASASVRKVLAQAKLVEDELQAMASQAGVLHPRVIVLREKLKSLYCNLIRMDLRAAQYIGIEQRLWRNVFYRPIEMLRTQLRSEQKSVKAGETPQTTSILSRFLKESEEFYSDLVDRVQQLHGDIGVELPGRRKKKAKTFDAAQKRKDCTMSCHQSLIYLGDVLRYREISLRNKPQHNFKGASICYRQAAYIWPRSGNPYNQLAVLSLYNADDIGALYFYYRAFYSEHSFPTAKDNLSILFGKRSLGSGKPSQASKFSFENCCACFLQATGALFHRISDVDAVGKAVDDSLFQFRELCKLNEEGMQIHMASKGQHMVKEIRLVHFFIKVVVIAICSAENALSSLESQANAALDQKLLNHALVLAFDMQLFLIHSCKSLSSRLLPAMGTFSCWLANSKSRFDLHGTPELNKRLKKYTSNLTSLLKQLNAQVSDRGNLSCSLIEDVELRGFTPIENFQKDLQYGTWPSTQRSKESQWRRAVRLSRIIMDLRVLLDDHSLFSNPIIGFSDYNSTTVDTGAMKEDNIVTWKGNGSLKRSLALPEVEDIEISRAFWICPKYQQDIDTVHDTFAFLSKNFLEKQEEVWKAKARNLSFNVHKKIIKSIVH